MFKGVIVFLSFCGLSIYGKIYNVLFLGRERGYIYIFLLIRKKEKG